jgi:UDP-N-acetylmuramate dehydrogenase
MCGNWPSKLLRKPDLSVLSFEENRPLKDFTSWLVGGSADHYCAPTGLDQIPQALEYAWKEQLPVSVLGGGTNVLISDQGVRGLVIHTYLLNKVEIINESDEFVLEAWCGTPKSEVLKHFLKRKLRPAVFLAGLPGDVGGGVVMNAGVGHGTSPKEFCEIVKSFDVVSINENGQINQQRFHKESVHWHYRRSENWQPGIITQVQLSWPNTPEPQVLEEVRSGNKRRKSTQPLQWPSCGSVFKNPSGDHAGRLIESAGLKGYQVGGAQVSDKHANFIINQDQATATDIHQLIQHVEKTVYEKFQIQLTNEVVYLGAW